jgi:hypothetical protein
LNAVRNNFGASLPASPVTIAAAAPRSADPADRTSSPQLAAKQHARLPSAADAALGELLHEWTLAGISQKPNGRNAKRS